MKYRIMDNGPIPEEIADRVGDRIVATVLWNRGYRSTEEIEAILDPDGYTPCPPFALPGMAEGVALLSAALQEGSRIAVYGDYDVDGVTATALLVRTLKAAGADVVYHVPNRFTEGYGMHPEVVRRLAEQGCRLIVTCDCGISNYEEIALAKELGMTVIVTDHHNIPTPMVPADVVVNPKLLAVEHPCYHIPGVGVAYLLSQALQEQVGFGLDFDGTQLAALGVVSDVVSLSRENRYWVRKGLEVLNSNSSLPGIQALLQASKIDFVDEEVIGFQLGPRLNAPGRVTSADLCVKLLLADDFEEAYPLAMEIDALNKQRKMLVEDVLKDFDGLVPEGCIVEYNPYWHEGVIGIAAGRLCERHGVPVVLMTNKEDGVTISGSARSIAGVNIFEALQTVSEYLTGFGGHAKAAGLRTQPGQLEKLIGALRQKIAVNLEEHANEFMVDLELPIADIDLAVYDQIRRIAPYGEDFLQPVFYASGVTITDFQPFASGKYTRLTLKRGGETLSAVWWESGLIPSSLDEIQIIYTVGVNRFQGTRTVQIDIIGLEEKTAPARPVLMIEDRRYLPGNPSPVITGDQVGIFAEGRPPQIDVFNRYQVGPCQTLVLSTIPPNLQILKEMVKNSGCSRLVLAYQRSYDSRPLLYRLMSVLKGIASRNEQTTVQSLAVICAETEAAIIAGLSLLETSGFLRIEEDASGFKVTLLNGGALQTDSRQYHQLTAAETETTTYRKWMSEVTIEELRDFMGFSLPL